MSIIDTGHRILCCSCGVPIPPNPINTCVNCLQQHHDIGAGVAKQVQQHTCRGCSRFERRDGSWAAVEPESKELLALLLKKPRGLGTVRLADATFVWTEPHSKRIKLKVTIQKEIVAGAVLQQSFVIEYVLGNKQCPICQRREAKDTWMAVVQVRQKVSHKRTFLWLEQLILKHNAHADTVNITELQDGLDFFFDQRSHAEKLVSFLQTMAPVRYKQSKQLVSEDTHTGKGKTKLTYIVDVLPICKDDLVWLPRPIATRLGHISQLCFCCKVSNVVHVLDPTTLGHGEMQPMAFWKHPFKAALSRSDLIEYVVLDVEMREPRWRAAGRSVASSVSGSLPPSGKRKESEGGGLGLGGNGGMGLRGGTYGRGRDSWALADVTVARKSDFGSNDRQVVTVTHLGHLLKPGDHVWGYAVAASVELTGEISLSEAAKLPEVLLVKKSYTERRGTKAQRRRLWKLRTLEKERDAGVQRGRNMDTASYEQEYESFMQELEEDPDMRSQINLYKDEEAIEAKAQREAAIAAERARAAQRMVEAQAAAEANDAAAAAAAQAAAQQAMVQAQMAGDGADYDADDNDEDDDFPDVGLEELLDDLTLGGDGPIDEGEEGESSATVAPAPVTFAPAGVAGPSEDQFALPGGNANATFHF